MTFVVSDLDRMERFLVGALKAVKVYDSGSNTYSLSPERFFLIGDQWIAIMEGESLPDRTYNHVAFKIADEDFDDYLQRIRATGAQIRDARSRVPGEGRSIYFYDFDNHLFEVHTGTLQERLTRYQQGP